jgi:hypothetical protein
VIAAYTAARKRSWAQKILGPGSLTDSELFLDGAFADVDELAAQGKKMLACNDIQETTIKNHTCVLGAFCLFPCGLLVLTPLLEKPPLSPKALTTTCQAIPCDRTWPRTNLACFLLAAFCHQSLASN